ncbi:hypothetical protein KY346_04950 [Candidatus Woesearchaeota archaeon]|nr:hypothetical protein [Candidatus Woesearchaeota archaeon]
MGWEEFNLNDDEQSIDDKLPEGWDRSHVGLICYTKQYGMNVKAEIVILENYDENTYSITTKIMDTKLRKKLSEKEYSTNSKESMDAFVEKVIALYDKIFPNKDYEGA